LKIVADENIPFLRSVLDNRCQLVYMPGSHITANDLVETDALLTRSRTRCNEELLRGSRVSFIATATIGYDHIDTAYCDRAGIIWTNAPGCNSASVAQYLLSVLVHLADNNKLDLAQQTLGIIGVGHVGSKVAAIAENLGMKVLLNDPPRERSEGQGKFVSLDEILAGSDIITLHVPLTKDGQDKTFHLVDDDFISGLQKKPALINSSRGEVADTQVLKRAIRNGKIQAPVLDVWENEPGIDLELMAMAEIATPHIAGYSLDGKANGTSMSVRALSNHFKLGLDNWYPSDIQEPDQPEIIIEGSGLKRSEILKGVVSHSYDIMRDDAALRAEPDKFEELRGTYPDRREPGSYIVRILNDAVGADQLLDNLGFQVLSDFCC